MTSPYLDRRARSIDDARLDLRLKRCGLIADQAAAREARNWPVVEALDRAIDAIDRQDAALEREQARRAPR